jgi:hypothetical protein
MFKKKEKIKLTCNAPSTGLIDLFPIVKGRDKMPDFFKSLPKQDIKTAKFNNVRICPGLTDLYNRSVVMSSWQDYEIKIHPNGQCEVYCPQEQWSAEQHPIDIQASGAWPGYINIKLASPWLIECNRPILWTMVQAVWDQQTPDDFTVVPGMLEFKYQNMSNINLLFKIPEQTKEYKIKAGDSLALLVPNTEEDFDIENVYMDDSKWKKIITNRWQFGFGPSYSRIRSILKGKKH